MMSDTISHMTTEKLRAGVIGVGRMGRHHARVYAQGDGSELVGVVDLNAEARDRVTSEWGGRGLDNWRRQGSPRCSRPGSRQICHFGVRQWRAEPY